MRHIAFLLALLPLAALAQEPLLTPRQMPNAVRFLPPPPDTASAAFAYDRAQYRRGVAERADSARLAIARRDAVWSVETVCREFSEPVGLELSAEATPAIYRMLLLGLLTTDQVGKLPKDHYNRTRPYVYFGEPTIAPGDEEALRHNGSYPSGHTILGWSAALLLTELAPERADTILARGYMFGQSRVIAGFHWQSDVDAARLAASAAVARLHADRRFQRLMKRARKEYKRLCP
ncbi:MAG: phosphatase PAP2 family protein [Bacteroidales bacterium]|nr:phosphatase PAP2 family protein [Bacteroidales bacterium]